MIPLKTLKGSKIGYSKFGVGKRVGSKIYFHKSVWNKITPKDVWDKAMKMVSITKIDHRPFQFNTVCYDLKEPHIVRLDTCPGFDTEREPVVGLSFKFNTLYCTTDVVLNNQIYHHKWLWVLADYEGFDVQESYEWSKRWLSKLPEVASGYPHKWE
jgi:hypothetical protein